MDVDISVAGNLWHIFRPADSPAVVSYRTAHARRFLIGDRLIGFAPHVESGPITRRAHWPRAQARARAPGRGKMCLRIDRPDHLASRICVYCTGYDSMIFIKARL